jgi:hypothetical protein
MALTGNIMMAEQDDLLEKIAAFPLEAQNVLKRDDDVIYAFNAWSLTVGDVKRAREICGRRKQEAPEAGNVVSDLQEQIEDLRSTMNAWFDLSKKTEAAIDGLKGYLRTSKCGGMPTKLANAVEAVLENYCQIYAGRALVPVLRGIAATIATAADGPAIEASSDLVQRCKELLEWRRTGLLNKGSGGAVRAYAKRLEADGISEYDALGVAESNTFREAMLELVRLASWLPSAASRATDGATVDHHQTDPEATAPPSALPTA